MKQLVLDSSSIISLSDSCLFSILKGLHQELGLEFFVPKAVLDETVLRPMTIKRFELSAVRVKKGIEEGWLKVHEISDKSKNLVKEIISTFNNLFFVKGLPLEVVQLGEIEALALIKELNIKIFVVDERTVRLLLEKPESMKKLLELRHKSKIELHKENLFKLKRMFSDLTIIRSTELVALASKYGVIANELTKDKQSLEAALYSVKFNGCSVSEPEIIDYLNKINI